MAIECVIESNTVKVGEGAGASIRFSDGGGGGGKSKKNLKIFGALRSQIRNIKLFVIIVSFYR